jgi:alpha/beta superfamily hydrolase
MVFLGRMAEGFSFGAFVAMLTGNRQGKLLLGVMLFLSVFMELAIIQVDYFTGRRER